jgi:hypothetical protein
MTGKRRDAFYYDAPRPNAFRIRRKPSTFRGFVHSPRMGARMHHAPPTATRGTRVNTMQDIIEREPKTTPNTGQREGWVARSIEQQTAKLPSDAFLWAALGSIGASLILTIAGDQKRANFVGQWAPTFLILGLYNKLVKLHGSDNA